MFKTTKSRLQEYIERIEQNDETLSEINLHYCGLDNEDVRRLMDALSGHDDVADRITTLKLSCNKFTEIYFPNLKSLTVLILSGCKLTELDVSKLTSLKTILADYNKLDKLYLCESAPLEYLNLHGNQFEELNLHGLEFLKKFEAIDNGLKKLNFSGLSSLEEMEISENKLEELDVSQLKNLKTLLANGNKLNKLYLCKFGPLVSLYLDENELEYLDFSGMVHLERLILNRNNFIELDLSELTSLKCLSAVYNKFNRLNKLYLCKSGSLEELHLSGNAFEELDWSLLLSLKILCIDHNNFSELNLPESTSLVRLNAGDNKFTELDVSKCKSLQSLFLSNTPIKDVDVYELSALSHIVLTNTCVSNFALGLIQIATPTSIMQPPISCLTKEMFLEHFTRKRAKFMSKLDSIEFKESVMRFLNLFNRHNMNLPRAVLEKFIKISGIGNEPIKALESHIQYLHESFSFEEDYVCYLQNFLDSNEMKQYLKFFKVDLRYVQVQASDELNDNLKKLKQLELNSPEMFVMYEKFKAVSEIDDDSQCHENIKFRPN